MVAPPYVLSYYDCDYYFYNHYHSATTLHYQHSTTISTTSPYQEPTWLSSIASSMAFWSRSIYSGVRVTGQLSVVRERVRVRVRVRVGVRAGRGGAGREGGKGRGRGLLVEGDLVVLDDVTAGRVAGDWGVDLDVRLSSSSRTVCRVV